MTFSPRIRRAPIGRWAWLLLSTAAVSACHHRTAPSGGVTAMVRASCVGTEGNVMAPGSTPARVNGAVDSAATQARVRWAIADLVQSLNSRSVADLGIRYHWVGPSRARDSFLERARASGATTTLALDTDDTRWSGAPGRPLQTLCLSLTVGGFNAGGIPTTQQIALRALAVDDGKGAWLSQLELLGTPP